MGEEGADARFGTYLTHSKQGTRYNASLVSFLSKGARRLGFVSFSVLYYRIKRLSFKLRKELSRLLSKGMSNIYLNVTTDTFSELRFSPQISLNFKFSTLNNVNNNNNNNNNNNKT